MHTSPPGSSCARGSRESTTQRAQVPGASRRPPAKQDAGAQPRPSPLRALKFGPKRTTVRPRGRRAAGGTAAGRGGPRARRRPLSSRMSGAGASGDRPSRDIVSFALDDARGGDAKLGQDGADVEERAPGPSARVRPGLSCGAQSMTARHQQRCCCRRGTRARAQGFSYHSARARRRRGAAVSSPYAT